MDTPRTSRRQMWATRAEPSSNRFRIRLRATPPLAALLLAALVSVACAAPARLSGGQDGRAESSTPTGTKRITAVILGVPNGLGRADTSKAAGRPSVDQLVLAGLSEKDGAGKLKPLLAEALPSVENGLWKVLADGRMEMTWRIRDGARWHDGAPLAADDLVFATVIDRDRELPLAPSAAYGFVEAVQAVDQRTVTVTWSRPYIEADTMFSTVGFAEPLPKHLLVEAYERDKAAFLTLSYWTNQYVGTGPFHLREFAEGSHVLLRANEQYALGRPRLDEIEVKFFGDITVLITNIRAGAAEMSLGRGFSVENAVELRRDWPAGAVQIIPSFWATMYPQFLNPNPSVISDVRFRRAMLHASDRESLEQTLQGGLTGVAHVFLPPGDPEYRRVEDAAIRYEYDPRKAAQMIQELGYAKGSDGAYRDTAGQPLSLEIRTFGVEVTNKATLALAEAWTQLGIPTQPNLVPLQRSSDLEYKVTFPAFLMFRQPNSSKVGDLNRFHSSRAALPENRFAGNNYGRYINPEMDAIIDRYQTTIPHGERTQALREFVRHMSELLPAIGLFYDAEYTAVSNRVQVTTRETWFWDAHLWDVKR